MYVFIMLRDEHFRVSRHTCEVGNFTYLLNLLSTGTEPNQIVCSKMEMRLSLCLFVSATGCSG